MDANNSIRYHVLVYHRSVASKPRGEEGSAQLFAPVALKEKNLRVAGINSYSSTE